MFANTYVIALRMFYSIIFDKRMEVKNSYKPLSCFAHVSYMYVVQNMDETFTV